MYKILIYGASDDLVEVEIYENDTIISSGEHSEYNETVTVHVITDTDNFPVTLRYFPVVGCYQGEWFIQYENEANHEVTIYSVGERNDLCSYSEVLEIRLEAESVDVVNDLGESIR